MLGPPGTPNPLPNPPLKPPPAYPPGLELPKGLIESIYGIRENTSTQAINSQYPAPININPIKLTIKPNSLLIALVTALYLLI